MKNKLTNDHLSQTVQLSITVWKDMIPEFWHRYQYDTFLNVEKYLHVNMCFVHLTKATEVLKCKFCPNTSDSRRT